MRHRLLALVALGLVALPGLPVALADSVVVPPAGPASTGTPGPTVGPGANWVVELARETPQDERVGFFLVLALLCFLMLGVAWAQAFSLAVTMAGKAPPGPG